MNPFDVISQSGTVGADGATPTSRPNDAARIDQRRREIFDIAAGELDARVRRRTVVRRCSAGAAVCVLSVVCVSALLMLPRPIPIPMPLSPSSTSRAGESSRTEHADLSQPSTGVTTPSDDERLIDHQLAAGDGSGAPTERSVNVRVVSGRLNKPGAVVSVVPLVGRVGARPEADGRTVIVRTIDDEQMRRLFSELGLNVGIVRMGSLTLVLDNTSGRPVFNPSEGEIDSLRLPVPARNNGVK